MEPEDFDVLDGNSSWIPSFDDPLPSMPGTSTPQDYQKMFASLSLETMRMTELSKEIDNSVVKSVVDFINKSISPPPSSFQFARISNMPDIYNKGVIQWPGIPPGSIAKIARENIAPLMIINMRQDDILRYASHSRNDEPWKPGWSILPISSSIEKDKVLKRDIEAAISFLLNCNAEVTDFRKRDALELTAFRTFLAALTRDSLTFDGMAIWTDTDNGGRIKAFKALSAQNIRLTHPREGYDGDPKIFAVGIDETGNVKELFTREELIWYVRNPMADPSYYGYGYPEIAQGVRLIQGFQNSIDVNLGRFTSNSIPNGMFIFKGQGWVRSQLDRLARLFINMKRGVTKAWTIPLIMAPKDSEIELLDFTNIKGNEVYYQDFMNMMIGAFCTLFRFPVDRLGYRISGKGPDREPPLKETGLIAADQDDPGREPLLGHIEHVINLIVWTRWPHLKFVFHGKNPKEDAREYEARILAMTINERRASVGLPPLHENPHVEGLDEEQKKDLILVGSAPVDPALAGVFQMALMNREKVEMARFGSKKDPAISETHGHTSGVRRNSAKEAEQASSGNNK